MQDNRSVYNSGIYDSNIINTLPYYNEYAVQIIDLVKNAGIDEPKWLDTGCGTGTLALQALEELPKIRFTLCDPSGSMLKIAKEKLTGKDVEYLNLASHQIEYRECFDIISAVQSHHYYNEEQREEAIRHCYDALKVSGIFITFENIRMSSPQSDETALRRWFGFMRDHGKSEEEIEMQRSRRGVETHPITIEDHLKLLKKCGFRSVDILWTSYLQAGFFAVK
ncbi:tRNA (cmo5U34)-methyltransferase [Lachnospiraceae bacterium XPB1003]|nr:tRNA (cmo5U34)-methyltransferase [Lachnospiraceae bacterium XPB1003]